METDVGRQALALAAAFCCGTALGAVYDALRFLRRHMKLGGAADVLFCIIAFAAAFVYAMSLCDGRLDIWAAVFASAGTGAYLSVIGDKGQRLLYKLTFPVRRVKKTIKNLKLHLPK